LLVPEFSRKIILFPQVIYELGIMNYFQGKIIEFGGKKNEKSNLLISNFSFIFQIIKNDFSTSEFGWFT